MKMCTPFAFFVFLSVFITMDVVKHATNVHYVWTSVIVYILYVKCVFNW